ncbi:MAG TPA: hypothetical protein VGD83_17385, partial [Streptosporangiaceae bacterium]
MIIPVKEVFEALHVPVEHLLERQLVVAGIGELVFYLHDNAFGRVGLEEVDADVTDSLCEIKAHVNIVMVDGEDILRLMRNSL